MGITKQVGSKGEPRLIMDLMLVAFAELFEMLTKRVADYSIIHEPINGPVSRVVGD